MNTKNTILTLLTTIVACIFLTIIAYNSVVVVETIYFDAHLNVSDHLGFNNDIDKIHFGSVIAQMGGVSERAVIYMNTNNFTVMIKVKATGDIAPYLTAPKQDIIVEPQEIIKIPLKVQILPTNEYKELNGIVTLNVKRDLFNNN